MIKRNEIQFYVLKDGLDMYMPKPASRAPPLSLLANETGDGIKQTRKGTAAFRRCIHGGFDCPAQRAGVSIAAKAHKRFQNMDALKAGTMCGSGSGGGAVFWWIAASALSSSTSSSPALLSLLPTVHPRTGGRLGEPDHASP